MGGALLEFIKRLPLVSLLYRTPTLFRVYHYLLAFVGALAYGFPSRKLVVIGVTGTKGKTTTCNLIAQILERAGFTVGLATTVNFKVADREWVNDTKQTMPGRFRLQALLREMVRAGCAYAVIETSSEGILQYRHKFIDYKVAVFTNLSPEHIERHGGFENYRASKVKLFEAAAQRKDGAGIYNLDDPSVEYFLTPHPAKKYGYTLRGTHAGPGIHAFQISRVKLSIKKTEFDFDGERIEVPLVGEFNVYNAAAAISAARSQGVSMVTIKKALKAARPTPGRFEVVDHGQGFTVVVDYAHEPKSLAEVYKAAALLRPRRMICLLGAQGGGRDKWKRSAMGKIAAVSCDTIILTNEDPYDEKPEHILDDIEAGIREVKSKKAARVLKIVDRREGIRKAVKIAGKGDVVMLTGKGGEVWMCVAGGKKIPWSDRKIVEEVFRDKSEKGKGRSNIVDRPARDVSGLTP